MKNKIVYELEDNVVRKSSDRWFGVFKKPLYGREVFVAHRETFKQAKKLATMLQNAYSDGFNDGSY